MNKNDYINELEQRIDKLEDAVIVLIDMQINRRSIYDLPDYQKKDLIPFDPHKQLELEDDE